MNGLLLGFTEHFLKYYYFSDFVGNHNSIYIFMAEWWNTLQNKCSGCNSLTYIKISKTRVSLFKALETFDEGGLVSFSAAEN